MVVQPAALLQNVTLLAFAVHIGAGTLALIAGATAVVALKGGRLHRRAGAVFVVSILMMAVFAGYLAVVRPGQIGNLLGAAFTFYLVATAWLTVRRAESTVGFAEKIGLLIAVGLCVPFGLLAFELAGLLPAPKGGTALEGPVLIASCALALPVAIAAGGDARVVLLGGISGAARIARHLWRMLLALSLATGSAFTNGLPRLLPGPMRVPPVFFLPVFVPLFLLVFWLIRVRLTSRFDHQHVASTAKLAS